LHKSYKNANSKVRQAELIWLEWGLSMGRISFLFFLKLQNHQSGASAFSTLSFQEASVSLANKPSLGPLEQYRPIKKPFALVGFLFYQMKLHAAVR
jgi:hypothetical protein